MSTLYIAEKPSQARDIAKVLGIAGNAEGYIPLQGGDNMTWAFGHLLAGKMPEDYNPAWKQWTLTALPLRPAVFEKLPAKGKSEQLAIIKKLMAKATRVVIATDAGREGELIARELLTYFRYTGKVERLWLSSLVESDIRKGLKALLPGDKTVPLYHAALAREESDWVYGLSMTRAATLALGADREVLPMGRVKTPTLAMVVKRCTDIENFKTRTYFELEAHCQTAGGHPLVLKHAPPEESRVHDKATAAALAKRAQGAKGPLRVVEKEERAKPPLMYTTPDVQATASNKFGMSAQGVLSVLQALYEKKVLTYPRTNCAHLGEAHKAEIPAMIAAIRSVDGAGVALLEKMGGPLLSPRLFDDSKLTDHHAIVPTGVPPVGLTTEESKVYGLVARRALQALAPDHRFKSTSVSLDANGVPLSASGAVDIDAGWTALK